MIHGNNYIYIAAALKKEGVLYASWKYGDKNRFDCVTNRYFCDMTDKKINELIKSVIDLDVCDSWLTCDVRNEYNTQNWINVLAKKI